MKDYASRSFGYSDSAEQRRTAPIHWGFIVAALIAMLVIYSVWWHVQQKSLIQPVVTAASTPVVSKAQPAVAPTAKIAPPAVKFDFYQTLTESPSAAAASAETTDNSSAAANQPAVNKPTVQASTSTAAQPEKNSRYYLEVGSYRAKSDALQQKANLILSEVSPRLIKVSGTNGHYRVLVGPYANIASATSARSNLKQNSINASLIKENGLKK